MDIREYIKENFLLFDGAMGTYFSQRRNAAGCGCELANLSSPELISDIHREYLEAGAKALKTNTFSANRIALPDEELAAHVIRAGWKLASEAAAPVDAYVFADIGPVSDQEKKGRAGAEYRWIAEQFLQCGAKHFLFETNSSAEGLAETAEFIKERVPTAYIICSFAVQPDGFTRDGLFASELLEQVRACPAIDAVGLNCVCGARHMLELARELDHSGMTLALMPNAGYPVVRNNRTFYEGDPAYFASQLNDMAAEGAVILGGCCGTTPVHIAQAKSALNKTTASVRVKTERPKADAIKDLEESRFWNRLKRGEKVFAVELDPPADSSTEKFMSGAWQLKGAGVDIITIADCPIARARMDSSLLACKIRRELGMDALPHMTCRDRNLNATKALLLGLYAEGVRNVLLITGDPIPTAERDEVKSVYQFNSRKLAAFASSLSEKTFPSPMHLFGALNVNARNFKIQLQLAKEKQEKGMAGFLTQPVLTPEAFENLKLARQELDGYILGGIIPVVSARNARFMDSEINGIRVDSRITELYEGKDRAASEDLAAEISAEIAKQISPYVDGYYLMTPFQRTGLIERILKEIKKLEG